MANVAAISGATGDDLQALRDKAREMGEKTKFSASEAADAILHTKYHLAHDFKCALIAKFTQNTKSQADLLCLGLIFSFIEFTRSRKAS